MQITIVDSQGIKEDVGPFDVEMTEDERATLKAAEGSYAATLDALNEIDSNRPDADVSEIAAAFGDFGDGAELEVG